MMQRLLLSIRRGWLIGLCALVFAVLLTFDLANHGLAWRAMWLLTGEEAPFAQLRGLVEWLGNFTRFQPTTAPYAPVQYAGVNPFGVNVFLEQEVEPEKRERQVRMIAEAGFYWIRQQFVWEDIEIHGRGDFTDRRNETSIGAVDAWAKYDQIVALAEQYGLEILARLDNPPAWAQTVEGNFAPPADVQDFVNFAAAVAERYRGRIRVYQVWNEPNIYPEWGEQAVDPEAYTELLCRTYDALKAVDPQIIVISGALSPTVSLTGRDLNEFIFLQRMYDAGAGACFDVLAAQGYGFFSGPTDRRLNPTVLNFGRHQYLRDLMVANGDAHKAIWITEAAWNPIDSPEVPLDVGNRAGYGVVTREQAAAYLPLAYQRAEEEWPWIGAITYWFFKRPSDAERGQSWYYFRMVEPDFTPLPVYDSIREFISTYTPALHRGVHQEDHYALAYDTAPEIITGESARFGRAAQTEGVTFTARGTQVVVRWRGSALLQVEIDGAPRDIWRGSATPLHDEWHELTLHDSLMAETHTFRLTAAAPFTLDEISVYERTAEHLTPLLALPAVVVTVGIATLYGIRRGRQL